MRSASARAWTPTTVETFDAWLERQGEHARWELVGGEIVAMTNPNQLHEKIVGNIAGHLLRQLDGRRCHVFVGGMHIRHSEDAGETDKPRPDIVVRCGPLAQTNYVTDPLAVVEVLSPSTMDVDRGHKLDFYKSLPTLRHIALVYQDQMRVELYGRSEDGWQPEVLTTPAARLAFEAVQFAMSLEQIYFGAEVAA